MKDAVNAEFSKKKILDQSQGEALASDNSRERKAIAELEHLDRKRQWKKRKHS